MSQQWALHVSLGTQLQAGLINNAALLDQASTRKRAGMHTDRHTIHTQLKLIFHARYSTRKDKKYESFTQAYFGCFEMRKWWRSPPSSSSMIIITCIKKSIIILISSSDKWPEQSTGQFYACPLFTGLGTIPWILSTFGWSNCCRMVASWSRLRRALFSLLCICLTATNRGAHCHCHTKWRTHTAEKLKQSPWAHKWRIHEILKQSLYEHMDSIRKFFLIRNSYAAA